MPISKHVSQSRHRAIRCSGTWKALTVSLFEAFTPLRRRKQAVGRQTLLLEGTIPHCGQDEMERGAVFGV
jgi:hypothetical protein